MSKAQRARWLLLAGIVAGLGLALSSIQPTRAAITPRGQQGCAAGTVVGGPNLVQNGDFSQGATGFTSQLPNQGIGDDGKGVQPDDNLGGGFSIQTGLRSYSGGIVIGRPFPGDPQREVPPTQTYFYSNVNRDTNGNDLYGEGTQGRALLWRQVVPVVGSTTYNFFAYFDNLIAVDNSFFADPLIELKVDGVAAGPPVSVAKFPDQWRPILFSFTTGPGQTSAALEIYDLANNIQGDDFGMTQISLKQCVTSVGLAKATLPPIDNGNGTYTVEFLLTVRNLGVDALPLREVQVLDDLERTFAGAGAFSVISLQASGLTVNPGFNGKSDKRLLTGSDSLAAKATATITLRVRVTPGGGPTGSGPFYNSAVVSAKAGTIVVEDDSNFGTTPDPNGNGDPKEPGEDRPTPIYLEGRPLFLPLLQN